MVLETIISPKYRIVTIATLAVLAAGMLGQLISSAVWWSRIHPWFGYGRGYYRVVYNCVFACFILNIIGFVVMVVVGAINIFAKELYAKITGSLAGTTLVITIVGACALAGLIPGAYGASWAVDRYKVPTIKPIPGTPGTQEFMAGLSPFFTSLSKFKKDANSHFCAGYVIGMSEVVEKNDWEEDSKKQEDYEKWVEKLGRKALDVVQVEKVGPLEDYIEQLYAALRQVSGVGEMLKEILKEGIPPLPNTYLCEQVGFPTLIFSMITALSMIVFFYLIVFNAYNQSETSEAEA